MSLLNIPKDVLVMMATYLDPVSLLSTSETCTVLREIARNNQSWQRHVDRLCNKCGDAMYELFYGDEEESTKRTRLAYWPLFVKYLMAHPRIILKQYYGNVFVNSVFLRSMFVCVAKYDGNILKIRYNPNFYGIEIILKCYNHNEELISLWISLNLHGEFECVSHNFYYGDVSPMDYFHSIVLDCEDPEKRPKLAIKD